MQGNYGVSIYVRQLLSNNVSKVTCISSGVSMSSNYFDINNLSMNTFWYKNVQRIFYASNCWCYGSAWFFPSSFDPLRRPSWTSILRIPETAPSVTRRVVVEERQAESELWEEFRYRGASPLIHQFDAAHPKVCNIFIKHQKTHPHTGEIIAIVFWCFSFI